MVAVGNGAQARIESPGRRARPESADGVCRQQPHPAASMPAWAAPARITLADAEAIAPRGAGRGRRQPGSHAPLPRPLPTDATGPPALPANPRNIWSSAIGSWPPDPCSPTARCAAPPRSRSSARKTAHELFGPLDPVGQTRAHQEHSLRHHRPARQARAPAWAARIRTTASIIPYTTAMKRHHRRQISASVNLQIASAERMDTSRSNRSPSLLRQRHRLTAGQRR